MEENSELEEGEAYCYGDDDDNNNKDNDENNNMDVDVDFSYIDVKIKSVLGHFQKDFEGSVSSENSRAIFGGYGTFLPTYERLPCISSRPKTPQKCSGVPNSKNLPMEGPFQSSKAPSTVSSTSRLGAASLNSSGKHSSGAFSEDALTKLQSGQSYFLEAHNSTSEYVKSSKSDPSEQRTLKFRLKMKRENAAIYNGLGLDNSPSSSLVNSPEENDGMPPVPQEREDESPTSILQVMTSFPVPGVGLISPLQESLISLTRKERFCGDNEPEPAVKNSNGCSSLLADESVSVPGDWKRSKEEENFPGKNVKVPELKQRSITFENDMGTAILSKKRVEMDVLEGSKGRAKLFSFEVKEDLLESMSGYSDKARMRNAQSCSGEKLSGQRENMCGKDVLGDIRSVAECRSERTSALSETYSDASKSKEDLIVRSTKSFKQTKQNTGKQVTLDASDEFAMSSGKEKSLSNGKKSQVFAGGKKTPNVSSKESLRVSGGMKSKHKLVANYGVCAGKDEVNKPKLQKDISKVSDKQSHSLDKNLEQTVSREGPPGEREKVSSINNGGIQWDASAHQFKERLSGQGAVNKLVSGAYVVETAVALEGLPKIDWVQCDNCEKWRMLPFGIKPEQLSENWTCNMFYWIPGMNRCEISEDETTKAVTELDQKNNLQNLSAGVAPKITSVHSMNSEQNHHRVDSHAVSSLGKKKPALKDIAKVDRTCGQTQRLNHAKTCSQDSVKSTSLNDVNQLPAESNLRKKAGLYDSSKSQNLVVEKHLPGLNEYRMERGDAEQVKKKNKSKNGSGVSKKHRIEEMYAGDKRKISDMGSDVVGFNSEDTLSNKIGGKDTQIASKYSFQERVKDGTKERLLISLKLGEKAQQQVSSDGVSSVVRPGGKRNTSPKKRKLLERQGNQDEHDGQKHEESCSKKAKISRIPKTEGKESCANSDDGSLNRKKQLSHTLLSSGKNRKADVIEEGRINNNDQQPLKHRRKCTLEQTLDGVPSFRKDIGSTQVSMTATSSSSKISGSLKTRVAVDDVKGSPVESVSSSPFRVSVNAGLSVVGKPRRCVEGEGDDKNDPRGTARKAKVSDSCLPEQCNSVPLDYEDGGSNVENVQKAEFPILPSGVGDIMEHHALRARSYNEVRLDKKQNIRVLFPQKSSKSSSLRPKESKKSSISDTDNGKLELSDSVTEQEDLNSNKIDLKSRAPFHGKMDTVKKCMPVKLIVKSSKDEKEYVTGTDPVGQCEKVSTMGNHSEVWEHHDSDARADAVCMKPSATFQEKNSGDFAGENKVDSVRRESSKGRTDGEIKREQCHQSAVSSQEQGSFDRLPVHASANGGELKALKRPRDAVTKNKGGQSVGNHVPDLRDVKDLNASGPGTLSFSNQTATGALKDAKETSDYADRLKSSGFSFESNEQYFQAALKFLLGASLQETHNSEENKPGEMSQIQAYNTAARLCKCCAIEYESRREMAAAALAYKCVEVAYWRLVYCKTSASIRDQGELQASLQMSTQGESPSSSTSDVDNLTNQATMDKLNLVKGAAPHVAGSPVFVARNHLHFLRLLDFTQDVNLAVEASRKCQNTFLAANVAVQEAQHRECIASIKKAIDFSFQDIEGFIHLVQLAMKAISRSGFGGTGD
ncbi:hypothetical protein Tsubulata_018448 [Turnera subulata]|uniref:CW-type domain-containing protein n=1 Tax=Turnera subulata TaxID=218843 RepID=A0A9Q0G7R1_9ROSI|nr:hypothetical protein Tsubulata_018448 [Turnera subulata]